jgi:DNA modification methylase
MIMGGFIIRRKDDFQKQSLAKTTGRRKKNAGTVAVHSVAAGGSIKNAHPDIKLVWRKPAELKAARRRVRKTDDRHLAQTVHSMSHFGMVVPLTIRGDQVVDGHIRLAAARVLELPLVPCIDVSHLSEDKARVLGITLNRLAETGTWDMDELKLELAELETMEFDLTLSGFTMPEMDIILSDGAEDKEKEETIPEPPAVPVTIAGDLWLLGEHRVLCGSALAAEDYARLMNGDLAAALLTDPPYNVVIEGNVSGLGKTKHGEFAMASGEMTREQFLEFLTAYHAHSRKYLLAGAVAFGFMDWRSIDLLTLAARTAGFRHINTAVWNKGSGGMGALYRSAHEFAGVFCNGDTPRVNNVELGKNGRDRTNVWTYPGANKRGSSSAKALNDHPTPKNVEMCADALRDVTLREEIVLDPFLGSGTTLIAAEQTARACYGLELEPKFVDVIVRRWEALTGKQAIHAETGATFKETGEDAHEIEE